MSKKMLNYSKVVDMADLLRKHCACVGGYAVYEEGWSDEVVLGKFSEDCSISSVKGLREKLIGPLQAKVRDSSLAGLNKRVAALEEWATMRPVKPYDR